MLQRQILTQSGRPPQAVRATSPAVESGWRDAGKQSIGRFREDCGRANGGGSGSRRAFGPCFGAARQRRRWQRPSMLLLMSFLMYTFGGRTAAGYQQSIVQASFDHIGRPGLSAPLQIKCAGGGDRIHIIDLYYKINVCRAVEFRQTDAASDRNLRIIEQCTGKRVCVVREYDMTSPFLDSKQGCLLGGGMQADEMSLLYKCVPPDKVRSICSSFETLESEGYLATSGYPQPVNASEGKNPCVCDLRSVDASGASSSGRVYLSFAELDLGSDKSHLDPTSCQLAEQRQHVQIQYSYGMSSAYELCKHRYNYDVPPSQVFKVIFTNPISRETGKLWMLYKVIGERQDVLVRVKCYSLHRPDIGRQMTPPPALAYSPPDDIEGESEPRKAGISSLLLPLIIALGVFLVLIIGAAIIIMSIRHRRQRRSDNEAAGGAAKSFYKKSGRHGTGVPEVCDDDDSQLMTSRRGCRRLATGAGAASAATGAVGDGVGAGSEEKGDVDTHRKAAGRSPDVASQATTAGISTPPQSKADVLTGGDCEMDVKSYRPFDTLVYTKLKARPSPDTSSAASERTSLVGGGGGGGPHYVTLPRKTPPSESDDDETSLVEQSSPLVSVSRQGSSNRLNRSVAVAAGGAPGLISVDGDAQCSGTDGNAGGRGPAPQVGNAGGRGPAPQVPHTPR